MSNKVKIAIDAMGGENSPRKIIEGIEISLKKNQENFQKISRIFFSDRKKTICI